MVLLDVTIPYETFLGATDLADEPCYEVSLCGPEKRVLCSGLGLSVQRPLATLRRVDTIVIPGMREPDIALPENVRKELIRAYARGARLVSICSGAFLLAQTGLLDGKRATTHWRGARDLKERHPRVEVDEKSLYIDEGRILTSAGGFAGLDLCLYLVRKDFGAAVASHVAKRAVAPLERAGGQAQFISHELPEADDSLHSVLIWLKSNLDKDLSIAAVAKRAGMSVRTLGRQFQRQTGISPYRWILRARVQRARELLETTDHSIERIADLCGFSSALSLRENFREQVLSSPTDYRRSFRSRDHRAPRRI